jgi:hypothetical protein
VCTLVIFISRLSTLNLQRKLTTDTRQITDYFLVTGLHSQTALTNLATLERHILILKNGVVVRETSKHVHKHACMVLPSKGGISKSALVFHNHLSFLHESFCYVDSRFYHVSLYDILHVTNTYSTIFTCNRLLKTKHFFPQ